MKMSVKKLLTVASLLFLQGSIAAQALAAEELTGQTPRTSKPKPVKKVSAKSIPAEELYATESGAESDFKRLRLQSPPSYTLTQPPSFQDVSLEPINLPSEPVPPANFPPIPFGPDLSSKLLNQSYKWGPHKAETAERQDWGGSMAPSMWAGSYWRNFGKTIPTVDAWELFGLTPEQIETKFHADWHGRIWLSLGGSGYDGSAGGAGLEVKYADGRVCRVIPFSPHGCAGQVYNPAFKSKQEALMYALRKHAEKVDMNLWRFDSTNSAPLKIAEIRSSLPLWNQAYVERRRICEEMGQMADASQNATASKLCLSLGDKTKDSDIRHVLSQLAAIEKHLGYAELLSRKTNESTYFHF